MILDQTGCLLEAGGAEYRVTLPRVTDISAQEGIRLDAELLEEGISEIEVTLYPRAIYSKSGREEGAGSYRRFFGACFSEAAVDSFSWILCGLGLSGGAAGTQV